MQNGKGDEDNRSPNFKLRRDNYDNIFGSKKEKNELTDGKSEVKSEEQKNEKTEFISPE